MPCHNTTGNTHEPVHHDPILQPLFLPCPVILPSPLLGQLLLHHCYYTTNAASSSTTKPVLQSGRYCPVIYAYTLDLILHGGSRLCLLKGRGISLIIYLFVSVRQATLAGNRCSQCKANSTGNHNQYNNSSFDFSAEKDASEGY